MTFPLVARAQDSTTQPIGDALRLSGGPCLTIDDLAAQLAGRGHSAVDTSLEIHVSETRDRIEWFFSWGGGTHSLDVGKESCPNKTRAIAVKVAFQLDKGPPTPRAELIPSPTFAKVSPPAPTIEPSRAVVAPRPSEPGARALWHSARPNATHLHARAGIEAVTWIEPALGQAIAFAPFLNVGIRRPLDLRVSALATAPFATSLGVGKVDSYLLTGRVDVCVGASATEGYVRGCIGGAGGAIFATGSGFQKNAAGAVPSGVVAFRLDGHWHVAGPLGVTAGVDLFTAVIRPRFEVRSETGVIESKTGAPIAVAIGFGPSLSFW